MRSIRSVAACVRPTLTAPVLARTSCAAVAPSALGRLAQVRGCAGSPTANASDERTSADASPESMSTKVPPAMESTSYPASTQLNTTGATESTTDTTMETQRDDDTSASAAASSSAIDALDAGAELDAEHEHEKVVTKGKKKGKKKGVKRSKKTKQPKATADLPDEYAETKTREQTVDDSDAAAQLLATLGGEDLPMSRASLSSLPEDVEPTAEVKVESSSNNATDLPADVSAKAPVEELETTSETVAKPPVSDESEVREVKKAEEPQRPKRTLADALHYNNSSILQQDLPLMEPPTLHVMLSTQGRRHTTVTVDTTPAKSRLEFSSYLLINHADPEVRPTVADGFGPDKRPKKAVLIASTGFFIDPQHAMKKVEEELVDQCANLGDITHVVLPSVDLPLLSQTEALRQILAEAVPNATVVIPADWSSIFTDGAAYDRHVATAVQAADMARTKRVPVHPLLARALKEVEREKSGAAPPNSKYPPAATIAFPALESKRVASLELGATFAAVPWRPLRYGAQGRECAVFEDQATDSVFVDAALGRFLPWLTHVPHRIALTHEEAECIVPAARSDLNVLGRPRELAVGTNVARDYLGLVTYLKKRQWARTFHHSFGMSEFADVTLKTAEEEATAMLEVLDKMHLAIMRDGALQCDVKRFSHVLEKKLLHDVLFKDASFPKETRVPSLEDIEKCRSPLSDAEAAEGKVSTDPAVLAVKATVQRDVVPGLFRFALGMRKPHAEPKTDAETADAAKAKEGESEKARAKSKAAEKARGLSPSSADATGLAELFEQNGLGVLIPVLVKEEIDMGIFRAMPAEDIKDVFKTKTYGQVKKLQQLQVMAEQLALEEVNASAAAGAASVGGSAAAATAAGVTVSAEEKGQSAGLGIRTEPLDLAAADLTEI